MLLGMDENYASSEPKPTNRQLGQRRRQARARAEKMEIAREIERQAALSVPEWGRILAMAEASLDEQGEERLEKWRNVAAKRHKRMAKLGIDEKADIDAMRRALCDYYADMMGDGMRHKGIKKVFAEAGASFGDFVGGAKDRYADLNLVYTYIQRLVREAAEADAVETVQLAQDGQRRLLTEDDCKLNQRAVEVSLKATMRNVYGEDGGGGGRDKTAISYNFPNMTLNWIVAPGKGGDSVKVSLEKQKAEIAEAIDVAASEEAVSEGGV